MHVTFDPKMPKRPYRVDISAAGDNELNYLKGEGGRVRRFATEEAAQKAIRAALAGKTSVKSRAKKKGASAAMESAITPISASATPTAEMYAPLQAAFDFFNHQFFDGELPSCLLSLGEAQPRVIAHYQPDAFVSLGGEKIYTDEIAFNPAHLSREAELTLSTLVHEMTHAWRHRAKGKPATRGYHDKAWAEKMLSMGLKPFAVNNPAKMTGHKVSHNIQPGGRFQLAARELLDSGWAIGWAGARHAETPTALKKDKGEDDGDGTEGENPEQKRQTRAKYICPECGQNAWAAHSARLICGACDSGAAMEPAQ
jgi:ribosomal protein S27AE